MHPSIGAYPWFNHRHAPDD